MQNALCVFLGCLLHPFGNFIIAMQQHFSSFVIYKSVICYLFHQSDVMQVLCQASAAYCASVTALMREMPVHPTALILVWHMFVWSFPGSHISFSSLFLLCRSSSFDCDNALSPFLSATPILFFLWWPYSVLSARDSQVIPQLSTFVFRRQTYLKT